MTRDGKPTALLLEVTPENLEQTIAAVRRSLFSDAVSQVRRRASTDLPSDKDIEREIQKARE